WKKESDFLKSQFPQYGSHNRGYLWDDIYKTFAFRIEKELIKLEKIGVKIKRSFRLTDLALVKDYKVFTLFGHHSEKLGVIELFDGLYSTEKFIQALPNFNGLFDLT